MIEWCWYTGLCEVEGPLVGLRGLLLMHKVISHQV